MTKDLVDKVISGLERKDGDAYHALLMLETKITDLKAKLEAAEKRAQKAEDLNVYFRDAVGECHVMISRNTSEYQIRENWVATDLPPRLQKVMQRAEAAEHERDEHKRIWANEVSQMRRSNAELRRAFIAEMVRWEREARAYVNPDYGVYLPLADNLISHMRKYAALTTPTQQPSEQDRKAQAFDWLARIVDGYDVQLHHENYDPTMPVCLRCTGPDVPGGIPDIDTDGCDLLEAIECAIQGEQEKP